ncbi:MAG: hypothetical protein HZA95_02360 [Candidatus Vogelbacteria bacterium]|nr:hypothetical protein [Candidatus Vogelbacteria bacterium]
MQVKYKKIGLDFDGTMIDHSETIIDLAKAEGVLLEKAQTNSNVWSNFIPKKLKESIQEEIYSIRTFDAVFFDDAVDTIKELINKYRDLYIVCARRDGHEKYALEYLTKERFFEKTGFKENNIIFTADTGSKIQKILDMRLDWYLDDKIQVAEKVNEFSTGAFFDNYNLAREQKIIVNSGIPILSSWKEVGATLL